MRIITNCFAGLLLGGIAQALLYPASVGIDLFQLKLLMSTAGNLLGIVFFLPLCLFVAKKRQRDLNAAALASGLALAIGAIAGSWFFKISGRHHAIIEVGVPVAFIVSQLKMPKLKRRTSGIYAALFVLITIELFMPFNRKEAHSQRFDINSAPNVPQPNSEFTAATNMPDVILISVDTLRADVIEKLKLPYLDALTAKSISAPYALAPASATLPSHISMVTGESPLQHAAYTNFGKMPSDMPTLAEAFNDGGYRAIGTAANGLLDSYTGFDRGFELIVNVAGDEHKDTSSPVAVALTGRRMVWYSAAISDMYSQRISKYLMTRLYSGYDNIQEGAEATAPLVRDLTLRYLDQLYLEDTPFFYFLHFMDPHLPYHANKPYLGQLDGDRPLPEMYADYESGSLVLCRSAISTRIQSGDADEVQQSQEVIDIMHDRYHEEMLMVDDALGAVFERIEKSKRPTIILFTSDHGEHFGENDLMLHGDFVHAANIRVPFMLSVPGQAGRVLTEAVPTLQDIPITLLRAAGFNLQSFGSGRDLLAPKIEDNPFASIADKYLAVQDGNYKLICKFSSSQGPKSKITALGLYSVENDGLDEAINLLDQPQFAAITQQLLDSATEFKDNSVIKGMRVFDAQEIADLDALGYVLDED
ncbi:MAG: sulfatase-like hydrolase/transferase [Planctomycetes bacterium]|nr:sulfatase-like hydrolase/transferase [Planctomycetota bacterium]